MRTLRLILGDQLSHDISSLADCRIGEDVILMCEVMTEATYVRHHKKKIAFLFSCMRHFARELEQAGHRVDYITLDDHENGGSFRSEVDRAIHRHQPDRLVITEPGEYRLMHEFSTWQQSLGITVDLRNDDRFLIDRSGFAKWLAGRKQPRMEHFYRMMRRQHGILMDGDQPAGGQWNFDTDNRKPPKTSMKIPDTYQAQPDELTRNVMALVAERFDSHFGDLEPFHFAVTREQALHALERFIDERLVNFGSYQDAMVQGEPWMYHSHLSFYINCGLLSPMECIQAAETAYLEASAPINAVEGFIRQILGWREYVRGIYWSRMPGYENQNHLDAHRDLPDFFWNGDTRMNCLKQCIDETRQNAYAHHIQRLMVIGNFMLLAGIEPQQVNEWFLIVYADAYEWVEMPNVTGMILHADGGLLGSKPYAASGAYINRMSDYCRGCTYKVSKKTGPDACPFNYLYWGFLMRNRDSLQTNARMGMIYRTLDRMSDEKIADIESDNARFFSDLSDEKI